MGRRLLGDEAAERAEEDFKLVVAGERALVSRVLSWEREKMVLRWGIWSRNSVEAVRARLSDAGLVLIEVGVIVVVDKVWRVVEVVLVSAIEGRVCWCPF